MERTESVLEAIYEAEEDAGGEEETLDEDVEMLDAETLGGNSGSPARAADRAAGGGGGGHGAAEGGSRGPNQRRRASKKKNKKKKRKSGSAAFNITDINRFVIDTCRNLKEKKSYLVWNAVGCLGVSAVSDLVKEVDAIQGCGGQRIADGRRFRTGGGILWNILKIREPKAYKEIMAKGREFEKQFRQPKTERIPSRNKQGDLNAPVGAGGEAMNSSERGSDSNTGRMVVRDKIRVPVAYDELFEEGEIYESTPDILKG